MPPGKSERKSQVGSRLRSRALMIPVRTLGMAFNQSGGRPIQPERLGGGAMRRMWTVLGILAWFAGGFAAHARAQTDTDFTWNGNISRGKSVEIKGVNGDVEAVLATGSRVEVIARKHARRSNVADVRVEVVEHDGNVTLCAVYPTPSRSYSSRSRRDSGPNECRPGEDGRMNTDNNDVQVDFTV